MVITPGLASAALATWRHGSNLHRLESLSARTFGPTIDGDLGSDELCLLEATEDLAAYFSNPHFLTTAPVGVASRVLPVLSYL